MLFTLFIINYSVVREEKNKFTNLILHLNNFIISSFYLNNVLKEILEIKTCDLNKVMDNINEIIRIPLRDLYLTSYNMFKIIGFFFIICFKYIKHKKEHYEGIKNIINNLSAAVENTNQNVFLANLLYIAKQSVL